MGFGANEHNLIFCITDRTIPSKPTIVQIGNVFVGPNKLCIILSFQSLLYYGIVRKYLKGRV
jgi:hypothetical protein